MDSKEQAVHKQLQSDSAANIRKGKMEKVQRKKRVKRRERNKGKRREQKGVREKGKRKKE